MEEKQSFRTLRGFINGNEPDDEIYFSYSATLRIFGKIPDLEMLTSEMGFPPTDFHRIGEKKGDKSPGFEHDMWSFKPSIPETEPLGHHIDALWAAIKSKTDFLISLKKTLTVDVFLGYRTNCDLAGVEIPHSSLEMFRELQIPLGISIIIV
jgi:hypothetical protein